MGIDFRLLGPLEVVAGGRVLDVASPKQRLLLAMLLVHRNRPVSLDVLAEELWDGSPPSGLAAAVQTLVYRLRRLLAPSGTEESSVSLRSSSSGYLLEVDASRVDLHRFEAVTTRARAATDAGDFETAGTLFRDALSLWRGPALADFAHREFARVEATRLDDARLEIVELLADVELDAGHPSAALAVLEPHVGAHPLRERAWGQLMVALYRLGRQAEALRAYQSVRHLLSEELGIEPNPSLRTLEHQILLQSPELDGRSTMDRTAAPSGVDLLRAPGDTFAFLFTDIEASTRRWEGDRPAMASDLARHDELLTEAIESHGGHRFTHTGDGLGAAFPTASAALAAAVDGQRALHRQAWAAAAPLRVRMAVHAGAAEAREGTYLGPTLNRTARLLEMASGAQILCSHAAADLARDELPAGVALLDLGEHHLADLARPEQIYQVDHRDLPSAFPPLPSLDLARHNLPANLTSFIGRTAELDELQKVLVGTRLLTITGLGGAGKTRLALELAAASRHLFPDGVWLVELASIQDHASVPLQVMAALGILSGGLGVEASPPEERLCEYLRSRHLLLVLDNCEHLIDPVAHLVHTVLARCPDVTVLATSREVIGAPGEAPWAAPCLSLPPVKASTPEELSGSDAVALFYDRASTAQAGFGLTRQNAAAVGQICRRLDGIPLALELAAARVRVLGAHQIAERLDDRFQLLAGGPRTVASRHQTLRATMDWSYELLPVPEQSLLRRLSVFPQSFDLAAAEAVGAEKEPQAGFDVIDLLARLVDKSLVVVEAGPEDVRYQLLETVRQYGAEKLTEAGEEKMTCRRHRDFFLTLAEGAPQAVANRWIRRVDADQDNFRAALDWSLAQGDHEAAMGLIASQWRYWWFAGRLGTACQRLERALGGPDPRPSYARVETLLGLRWALLDAGGDVGRAEALFDEALDVALSADDPRTTGDARFFLGQLAHTRGDIPEARRQLLRALAVWEDSGNAELASWCHLELGWPAMSAGDLAGARAHFERALELDDQDEPSELLRSHVLAALAPLTAQAGDPDRAEALGEEAIRRGRRLPLRVVLVMALARAAQTAVLSGRQARARVVLPELLALLRNLGARRWVADALEAAALVLESEGRMEAAADLLAATGQLRLALGEPSSDLPALSAMVDACRHRVGSSLTSDSLATEEHLPTATALNLVLSRALRELDSGELDTLSVAGSN